MLPELHGGPTVIDALLFITIDESIVDQKKIQNNIHPAYVGNENPLSIYISVPSSHHSPTHFRLQEKHGKKSDQTT